MLEIKNDEEVVRDEEVVETAQVGNVIKPVKEKKEKVAKEKKEKVVKVPKEKIPAGTKEGTKTKAIVDAFDATGSVKLAVAKLKEEGAVVSYQQTYNTLVRLGKVTPSPKKVAEGEVSEGASVDITSAAE